MSKSRYAWIDSMLRDWVAKCDDTEFLLRWRETIDLRVREMQKQAELSLVEIIGALDSAKEGDPLFPTKRLRIPWDGSVEELRSVVYLERWDRDSRRLRVQDAPGSDYHRELDASEIQFYQIATQRLHVRRVERMRKLKTTEETEP